MRKPVSQRLLPLLLILLTLALDRFTKALAVALPDERTLIPGILRWIYVENTGMAFSLFSGQSWMLGVVSLIVVCAAANNGVLPAGTPFQTFSHSVASFLTTIFGVPQQIAACILTMCVSALALTSVVAVARIGRMSLQELFMPSEGEEKSAVQKVFTNTVFSTVLTLLGGYALCIAGYMSVWPLFGSANQLLSALVLTGLAVFLKSTGRKGWMLYGPMAIMFVVTMTALIEQIIKIFGAISAGKFVLMVHGLQLVVAVALIVLALLVVYHCVLKLKDAAPVIKRD